MCPSITVNKMHGILIFNDTGENSEGSEPLQLKFLSNWLAGHVWATRSRALQRELWRTCKRFKFNQAFRAGHLIFRLKLFQNSGSVVRPHSRLPTSSNLLTQSLWRVGIYSVLHSSVGTTVCVVGRHYQRPRVDGGDWNESGGDLAGRAQTILFLSVSSETLKSFYSIPLSCKICGNSIRSVYIIWDVAHKVVHWT